MHDNHWALQPFKLSQSRTEAMHVQNSQFQTVSPFRDLHACTRSCMNRSLCDVQARRLKAVHAVGTAAGKPTKEQRLPSGAELLLV